MTISVLVVEDESVAAQANAAYVERMPGFSLAAVAMSLQEAVRALDHGGIDLVLLDLNLPDGHGLDLLRQLRAGGHPTDVIAVTSARDLDVVRRAVTQGIAGYVLKPFSFEMLAAKLRQYATYRDELERGDGPLDQAEVDAVLGQRSATTTYRSGGSPLPKGLSLETLTDVENALADGAALTASEVAERIGASRVTARRYLEYLAVDGRLERRTRFGGAGRPHVEFVLTR